MKGNVEILSPAGNKNSFIAAMNAGADAIYMGVGKYNARTMAENFSIEEYSECIKEAHKRDVKIYLTLNTLMYDEEINEALNLVALLYSKGLDAVIVQDIGVAMKIHEIFPSLPLHASTQMSVYSKEQVNFLKSIGFTRVVLARELSVTEIEEICKSCDIEIEVFVHGALCVSFSGQCNMSKLIGDRSANRGSCAQPCRMKYTLYKEGDKAPIIKDKYILSKKDIWGLEHVQKLVDAGVCSLKIEGRNKFPEYVALATSVYKRNLTASVSDNEKNSLLQIFNRSGKSYGYLNGVQKKDSITIDSPKNVGSILGKVLDIKHKYIKLKLENNVDLHDGIEIHSTDLVSSIVTCIRDDKFNIINKKCSVGNYVWLGDINGKCKIGDVIYKTTDNGLNESVNKEYVGKLKRQKQYEVSVEIKKDKKVEASVEIKGKNITCVLECIPEPSIKHDTDAEAVLVAFSKTEDTSVKFEKINVAIDSGLFVPVSKLNELRRNLVEKIEESFETNIDISAELKIIDNLEAKEMGKEKRVIKNSLFIYTYNRNINYIEEYYKKYDKRLERLYIVANDFALHSENILNKYKSTEIFFVIPNVTLNKLSTYIRNNLENLIKQGMKGVLVGNLQYVELLQDLKKRYNIIVGADYSLNITNSLTIEYLKTIGFDFVTLSFELNEQDALSLASKYDTEVVENLACAMTSRYCIVGSFADRDAKDKCNRLCTRSKYYILDSFNKRYDIVCDNFDCIMRLIRNKGKYTDEVKKYASLRKVWL